MPRKILLLLSSIIFVAVAAIDAVAFKYFLYWHYHWFDTLPHFLGGLGLGFLALYLYHRFLGLERTSGLLFQRAIVISTASALASGLLWEVLERLFRNVATLDTSWFNTLSDLLFDFLGGAAAGAIVYFYGIKKQDQN